MAKHIKWFKSVSDFFFQDDLSTGGKGDHKRVTSHPILVVGEDNRNNRYGLVLTGTPYKKKKYYKFIANPKDAYLEKKIKVVSKGLLRSKKKDYSIKDVDKKEIENIVKELVDKYEKKSRLTSN